MYALLFAIGLYGFVFGVGCRNYLLTLTSLLMMVVSISMGR
jgi:NADH:ubiquinone oxidoreductase subunit K